MYVKLVLRKSDMFHTHVINVSHTCKTCFTHATHVPHTCKKCFTHMSHKFHTCHACFKNMSDLFYAIQTCFTYKLACIIHVLHRHVLYTMGTCFIHHANINYALNRHALYAFSTRHALYLCYIHAL